MQSFPILSILVFLPLIGALLLGLIFPAEADAPEDSHGHIKAHFSMARAFALLITLLTLAFSVLMLRGFNSQDAGMQLLEIAPWFNLMGGNINYALGVDGISLYLVLLTTILMPIVVLASHSVHKKLRGYLVNMLVLESAMIGTLLALDMFLFYVFWELMLIPMYFLIGIWGGKRRIYATTKFVLYTVVGSLLMLLALFYTVWNYQAESGTVSFMLSDLLSSHFSLQKEIWLFAAFALAFAIKVPIFPFHTWLPDAHVEAPTGGSVILAGVLLKMGLYGFIRFAYPLFPRAAEIFTPYLVALAVIGIVYGALVAWVQTDIKKLVAYSSVSHLGYCVLGFAALNTISVSGSIYQMLNHGVSTGALFLLVGVLYDRRHTREITEYGGLTANIPVFAFLFLVFTLSSIALPLTNGFVGEFMILAGSFQSFGIWTMIAATSGVVLGAIYMLSLYLRTCFGELDQEKNGKLLDVNRSELLCFLPLLFLVFYMGLFPGKILNSIEPTINSYLGDLKTRKQDLQSYESRYPTKFRSGGVYGASQFLDNSSKQASAETKAL